MTEASSPTAVQRRILRFFQDHPHAVETVRGIGLWVGEEEKVIREALSDLLIRKWLTADETAAITAYALTRDERTLVQIREAIGAQ